jgi:hypothetical protein
VVQRDPRGFSLRATKHAVAQAAAMDAGRLPPIPGLGAAVPVTNTAGAFPGSRERSTTIITFLYFRPGTSTTTQTAGAQAFARRYASAPGDHLVGVTGPAPAQDAQGNLIASFGSLLFRPGPAWFRRAAGPPDGAAAGETPAEGPPARVTTWQAWLARLATTRPVALAVAAACVAGLVLAGLGLTHIRLGFPLIRALPATSQEVRAEQAAAQGFVPGVMSPTEVLVQGPGIARQPAALAALIRRPGVAGVLGPATLPMMQRGLAQRGVHLMVARSGNAARYGVIERTDPLGPAAIDRVRELRRDLPALVRAAGAPPVRLTRGGGPARSGHAPGLGRPPSPRRHPRTARPAVRCPAPSPMPPRTGRGARRISAHADWR